MLRAFPDTLAFLRPLYIFAPSRHLSKIVPSIYFSKAASIFLSIRYFFSYPNFKQQILVSIWTNNRHAAQVLDALLIASTLERLEKRLNGVVTEKGLLSPWTRRGAGRQPIRPKNRTSVLVERYRPPSPPPPPAPSHPWKRHSNSDPFASESSSFSDSRSFETIHDWIIAFMYLLSIIFSFFQCIFIFF